MNLFERLCNYNREPGDNVDDILLRVRRGEMTPEDAEKWAKGKGVSFTGRPHPSLFDPRSEPSWTPLQAVAWIAYRDVEEVRSVSSQFRIHWFVWRPTGPYEVDDEPGKKYEGWFHTQIEPATIIALDLWEQGRMQEGKTDSQKLMLVLKSVFLRENRIERARKELWSELIKGEIGASGFAQGRGTRGSIPAIEWNDLGFTFDGPDVVRSREGLEYRGVLIKRDDILTHWPILTTLGSALREAANRNAGVLTQKRAEEIARERGVFSSRAEMRNTLKRLGIGGKQGRKKNKP